MTCKTCKVSHAQYELRDEECLACIANERDALKQKLDAANKLLAVDSAAVVENATLRRKLASANANPNNNTCQICNWTNTNCWNIGEPNGEQKWICPGCVKRELERLQAENAKLRRKLDAARAESWREVKEKALACEGLQAKLVDAQAETARLAAALQRCCDRWIWFVQHPGAPIAGIASMDAAVEEAMQGKSTALRDLLKPTVELLKRVCAFQKRYEQPHKLELESELSRLESL